MDKALLLQQLEEKLKGGRTKEVLVHLSSINISQLPRADRLPFAELARRAGSPELAVKFLIKIIYPHSRKHHIQATTDEYLSYASALRALGFLKEAKDILKNVNEEISPAVLLQRALLLFSEWKYHEAIRILKKFINSKKISDYQKIIGQVNLLSAYISSENYDKAYTLACILLEKTKEKSFHLLHGNCLELISQYYIFTNQYTKAKESLASAEHVLKDFSGIYFYYVKKWQFILMLLSQDKPADFDQQLLTFKEMAQSKNFSEIVRDLDFFKYLSEKNETQLMHVLVGTPIPSYLQRAQFLMKRKFSLPSKVVLNENNSIIFDYKNHHFLFKPLLRKLIWLLSKDFYKPISVGQVFSVLYPEECFNPETSVKRIDSLVYRLNNYFKKNHPNLYIQRNHYSYSINNHAQLIIYRQLSSNTDIALILFKKHLANHFFSRNDFEKYLNISSSSAKRLIQSAIKRKKIKIINKGHQQRYVFSNFRN